MKTSVSGILPIILSITLFSVSVAKAQVYTCIINGETVYTANPRGECQTTQLPRLGRYTTDKKAYRATTPTVKAKPRANYTNKADTQPSVNIVPKGSDTARRNILEQELANERIALAQAQQALAEGRTLKNTDKKQHEQYQNRVRQLESAVLDRQQNIQALQRELGRM
ncbi:hypothetical protein [Stenoxybacter acetivorans]|uniref:hypothetical protein n=1 Tax=Stenoxybacter acetivorans TaxID=422441 RepID=UPI0005632CCD|nr:hypothetical protein [Stenoxybacter acetivorans]